MTKKKRNIIVIIVAALVTAVVALNIVWVVLGFDFVGPYKGLSKNAILNKYDKASYQGNTIFYGASNFARWNEMEEDLQPYRVQNHAFGGSTDKDLVDWADELIFPYNPKIIFFQTGSNDYVESSQPSDSDKVAESMDFKKKMFDAFHDGLPDAKFVVIGGLLLPGRQEYTSMTLDINFRLREYCEELDYMYYLDSESLTYDSEEKTYREDRFVSDGIHLTHEARLVWANDYILPVLGALEAPKN